MKKQKYEAFDCEGRRIYRNLEIIARTASGRPVYGWPSGGFLDPLEVEAGTFTVRPVQEAAR